MGVELRRGRKTPIPAAFFSQFSYYCSAKFNCTAHISAPGKLNKYHRDLYHSKRRTSMQPSQGSECTVEWKKCFFQAYELVFAVRTYMEEARGVRPEGRNLI